MLVNSGAYVGADTQRNTMTAPSTSARPPMTAIVFWPAVKEPNERCSDCRRPVIWSRIRRTSA